jgi:hypothetical protein
MHPRRRIEGIAPANAQSEIVRLGLCGNHEDSESMKFGLSVDNPRRGKKTEGNQPLRRPPANG